MYINRTQRSSSRDVAQVAAEPRPGRYLSNARSNATRAAWVVAGTLGVLSAQVLEAQSGTADWATSQLRRSTDADAKALPMRLAFDSAPTVRHIRAVLGLSVTELSRLFGVSRQSVHEWSKGSAVSQENGKKLEKISKLADVLVEAGIEISPHALRRPLSSGKSLLETAISVDDVAAATRKIVTILTREAKQRAVVAERLAGRKSQPQELHRYISPRIAETG
jgi:DNA-binding transcriptional regulator YiaG